MPKHRLCQKCLFFLCTEEGNEFLLTHFKMSSTRTRDGFRQHRTPYRGVTLVTQPFE